MYNALLIGCGKIGALLDFDNENILTHAKAYFNNPVFKLSVYDIDTTLAGRIALRYNAQLIDNIGNSDFSDYDCISICSPTNTHSHYLKKALKSGVRVIICEKPVSYDVIETKLLEKEYSLSSSKVIVNYMRRFHPSYINLKDIIFTLLLKDEITNISVRYQRGFLNNCSHAFDLLAFLLNKELSFKKIQKSNVVYDCFDNDPTLSLQFLWGNIGISVQGFTSIGFSVFEIELFLNNYKISIIEGGNKIIVYSVYDNSFSVSLKIMERHYKENCLHNYMVHVVNYAQKLLRKHEKSDNFLFATSLNKSMIKIVRD